MRKMVVEILAVNEKVYKLKFPFLKVPVEMGKRLFDKHMRNKAYKIVNNSKKHIEKIRA